MIRRANTLCKLALSAAGGSFFLAPAALTAGASDIGVNAPVSPTGAALSITPLRIEFDRGANGATVYLTNESVRELAVQSRLFAWSQADGEDKYAPSSELTISPSISMIPPGETQIVRVLRKGAGSPGEKRFRLAVDQLPDPTLARDGQAEARIRFTLPVFLDRDTATPEQLAWRVQDDRLVLANTGGRTARIANLTVTAGGQPVQVGSNVLRYVQGNSTIAWPIESGCSKGAVRVTAMIDNQTVDVQPTSVCS
ncbi:fimbrial biogenesis chaperone [Tsuneonella amylolytica]|uniref:fimbrial biogenesis chaperone n=1 Tax=Tsuneonella amylolytica TaxID=2338327 RepID=UPI0013C420CF|nr:fimbria/pilus periplasmic chaperone [Tsuneonella amylolytica]